MLANKNSSSAADPDGRFELLLPGLLAIALLAILFPLPRPAIDVNQPFKVELFLCVFLIAFFVFMRRHGLTGQLSSAPVDRLTAAIATCIGAFILWSAASVLWGASLGSVAHHTLLWSAYLIVFLIFTRFIRPDASLHFIISTFVIVSLVTGVLCVFDYLTVVDFASSEGDIRIRYGKYAELLATISPVLWAAAIYVRDRRRMLLISLAGLLSWVTVMLSLSKGAFIAGIIGFAMFFFSSAVFSARPFRKKILVLASIWLVVTIGTQIFFSFFSAVPSTANYITGAADPTRSTTAMRIFTWSVARQMAADHWLTGVGADNFGLMFNSERIPYRQKHAAEPAEEIAEDYVVERAHNEPLQVLSELGVIGLLLFCLPFLIFAVCFLRSVVVFRRSSPVLWAAVAGMIGFVISSQFSSFSFRAAQNGVAFFMVLAIAAGELAKTRLHKKSKPDAARFSRAIYLAGLLAALLLAIFSLTKAFAEYEVYMAERSPTYAAAKDHFHAAITADPEYAGAYLSNATRASAEGNPAAAAMLTRKAIDNGLGVAQVYSQLARQQAAAGDVDQAGITYREALSIYPRSVFLRTEFAVFLERLGKTDDAAEQLTIARSIDLRQANGWYLLITKGSVATFYAAQSSEEIAQPAELTPFSAVRQYLDKIPGMEPAERQFK